MTDRIINIKVLTRVRVRRRIKKRKISRLGLIFCAEKVCKDHLRAHCKHIEIKIECKRGRRNIGRYKNLKKFQINMKNFHDQ